MQIGKEGVIVLLFVGDMKIYIRDLKNSAREILHLIDTFMKMNENLDSFRATFKSDHKTKSQPIKMHFVIYGVR